ncbi:MAG: hypothetical protein WBM90_13195 [Acidimicrobiia bacterium]
MGSFTASLKTIGDRKGLPATVVLENDRLSIAAGDETIGNWSLSEIRLERSPTGYRMAAEGEQILIELSDADAFESELTKKSRGRVKLTLPDKNSLLRPVDRGIAAAEKKFGSLLPEWVFTRMMFGVSFGALMLMVFLPDLISVFLLIAGLIMVLFGAVVYTDGMLASKWLPGRMSPMHVLLFGVVIVMLGVFVGVFANAFS